MPHNPYTITFYRDAKDEWRWRVTHSNGQIVGASSEGFSSEAEARANLERMERALHGFLSTPNN